MVVNLSGYKDINKVWVPVPMLGNPFSTLSNCRIARSRMRQVTGSVGRYKCKKKQKKAHDYSEMGSSPG